MPAGTIVRKRKHLQVPTRLARPYVLKPVNEGSSVGVAIVTDESNYGTPIGATFPDPGRTSTGCSPNRSSKVAS